MLPGRGTSGKGYFREGDAFQTTILQDMKSMVKLLVLATIFLSCKKGVDKVYMNAAVIDGINAKECPCLLDCPCSCGGLNFRFTDTTYTDYIPLDNPQLFSLKPGAVFPMHVLVNWKNTSRCGTMAISISDFKFQ
jgi:hypothetical protein